MTVFTQVYDATAEQNIGIGFQPFMITATATSKDGLIQHQIFNSAVPKI